MFNPYENPAYEVIHINNKKTEIRIYRKEGTIFEIRFTYNEKWYCQKLGPISNKEFLFSEKDIHFENLEIIQVDKIKIATRLNEIVDIEYN